MFTNNYFKKMSQAVLYALLLSLTFTACKKDSDSNDPGNGGDNNKPKTLTEMLTTGKWLEIDARDPNGSVWDQVPDCSKDDYMIFKVDGSYEYDNGPTKCKPTDPQIEKGEGIWQFINNETRINIGNLDYQIEELTDSKLTLLLSGPGYQLTTYYIKK